VGGAPPPPGGGGVATSEVGSPSLAVAVSSTSSGPVAATQNTKGPLEGRWSTGPIPMAQIKQTLLQAGVTSELADQWIAEVGSPPEYTFELEFHGQDFNHYETTPQMARNLGESGTYVYADDQLRLDIVSEGDTYRLAADLSGDHLQLRFLDSTERGTAEDKAKHGRYTIAFYTSGEFVRQP
jgi:hypothetical protein